MPTLPSNERQSRMKGKQNINKKKKRQKRVHLIFCGWCCYLVLWTKSQWNSIDRSSNQDGSFINRCKKNAEQSGVTADVRVKRTSWLAHVRDFKLNQIIRVKKSLNTLISKDDFVRVNWLWHFYDYHMHTHALLTNTGASQIIGGYLFLFGFLLHFKLHATLLPKIDPSVSVCVHRRWIGGDGGAVDICRSIDCIRCANIDFIAPFVYCSVAVTSVPCLTNKQKVNRIHGNFREFVVENHKNECTRTHTTNAIFCPLSKDGFRLSCLLSFFLVFIWLCLEKFNHFVNMKRIDSRERNKKVVSSSVGK